MQVHSVPFQFAMEMDDEPLGLEALYSYLPASIVTYLLDESNDKRLVTPSSHGFV